MAPPRVVEVTGAFVDGSPNPTGVEKPERALAPGGVFAAK
jgi:hypothetical protein